MRIPRSRGAVSGALLVLLGLFGALVPFAGPSLNFTIGPDLAWHWTEGRFWLSVLPGAATVLAGLILLRSAHRAAAGLGAWLGVAAGAWFVVGSPVSSLWNGGTSQAGPALGGTSQRVVEELAYFYGLGALIVAVAAFALGRLAVRSVRDAELEREALEGRRSPRDPELVDGRRLPREPESVEHRPAADEAPARADPRSADAPAVTTATAADRVRAAAGDDHPRRRRRGGRRGLFRRA